MESALWALNLCAVVFLCLWGIKMDKKETEDQKENKKPLKSKVNGERL